MWMTVNEAALKWNMPPRTIQHLCKEGKIKGATRFNRSWAIPLDKQPLDITTLTAILDQYPYKLNVTSIDGTMVFANQKFMTGVFDGVAESAIGHYNILTEASLKEWGLTEHIKKAFEGKSVTTKMLKFPNKELVNVFYGKEQAFTNVYQDITSYPVFNALGELTHIVTLFVPSEISSKRFEVMATKQYIDSHWTESLSLNKISKFVSLSESRLRNLFKSETGFTIREYYHEVKMNHICEMLTSPDLSISEVFNQCGLTYNSYYVKLFKSFTGITPREYRKGKKRFE